MILLYPILWCFSYAPWWLIYAISDVAYLIIYRLIRYRLAVVRKNLRSSFPEKSPEELKTIEKRFYRHFCDISMETIKFWHISEKDIKKRLVYTNPEMLNEYLTTRGGIMTINGHLGNWEWLVSFTLWMAEKSILFPLYKPLHNKAMDKIMYAIRSNLGCRPIHKKEMLRRIISARNEGYATLVAFIGDQRPSKNNAHLWLPFLNQETAVFPGTEKVAALFDFGVLYIWVEKKSRGHYTATFVKLCDHAKELPAGELTRLHTEILERNIKEAPELWLWSHNRWKYPKPEEA